MDVIEDLREFILKELIGGQDPAPLADDEDLVMTGLIDSLGVMQLARFMESAYGIEVGDADIVPENFRTLTCLADFLRGRMRT